MAKRSYVWNEQSREFVEREPEDRTNYADIVEARKSLDERAKVERERDGHCGNYL